MPDFKPCGCYLTAETQRFRGGTQGKTFPFSKPKTENAEEAESIEVAAPVVVQVVARAVVVAVFLKIDITLT